MRIIHLIRKLFFALFSRIYPELDRVDDESERIRINIVSASLDSTPRWIYVICALMCLFVFSSIGAAIALAVGSSFPISLNYLIIVIIGGWMAGGIVPMLLFHLVRLRKTRRWHVETMINLGYDICPECGYNLVGHSQVQAENRKCPECGVSLHPPPSIPEYSIPTSDTDQES